MDYRVRRGEQEFGPYTLSDLQRYVQLGNLAATDLAISEGMIDWTPVSQVLGTISVPIAVPVDAVPRVEPGAITELARHLSLSRWWVGAQFGWVLVWIWVNLAMLHLRGIQSVPAWFSSGLGVSYRILTAIAALAVQAGMLRSLMRNHPKRVQRVWGSLALLLWGMLYLVAAEMQVYLPSQILKWLLAWVVAPAIFLPIAAASSVWGRRLPWRRILRVVGAWRWWLGVSLAGAVGKLAELYFYSLRGDHYVWDVDLAAGFTMGAVDLLEMAVWVLLLGWLAVLFNMDRQRSPQ